MQVNKRQNEKGALKNRTRSLEGRITVIFMLFFLPQEHDINFDEHGTMVLGCGPYHIGKVINFIYIGLYSLHSTFHTC